MRIFSRIILAVLILGLAAPAALAADFGSPRFESTWERTDYPVQELVSQRSWTWGPEAISEPLNEWYLESPGSRRQVQYFDKSRMEINDPNADGQWAVTNGLLVKEMIMGYVQTGDSASVFLKPAMIAAAGDPDNTFPTYEDLHRVVGLPASLTMGDYADVRFMPNDLEADANLRSDATQIVAFSGEYGIPRVFYDWMNQRGTVYADGKFVNNQPLWDPTYVFGLPLGEPYWVLVRVGGVEQEVLIQPFERRIVTYTPANDPAWQVEMGNVGQHYWRWRYEQPFEDGSLAVITNPGVVSAVVASPLLVTGFENGQAFEARVTVRLRTTSGEILAEQSTSVGRPDINIAGPFEATLDFMQPETDTPGVVEVGEYAASGDGSFKVLASLSVLIAGVQPSLPSSVPGN